MPMWWSCTRSPAAGKKKSKRRAATFDDWPYEITEARARGDLFGSLVLRRAGAAIESFGFALTDPRAIEILCRVAWPSSQFTRSPLPASSGRSRTTASFNSRPTGRPAGIGPTVVVGDFNATPWSYPLPPPHGLDRSLELRPWIRSGPVVSGRRESCSFGFPSITCFFSDGLAVVDRSVRAGDGLGPLSSHGRPRVHRG